MRTRPPSAGQGERPRKEPALPTACSNTCSPRTAEKHIPVGEATQSVIFCDSSLANCPLLATHSHTHTQLKMRNSFKQAGKGGRVSRQVLYVCVVAMVRAVPRKPRFIYSRAGSVWWRFGHTKRDASLEGERGERQVGGLFLPLVFSVSARQLTTSLLLCSVPHL